MTMRSQGGNRRGRSERDLEQGRGIACRAQEKMLRQLGDQAKSERAVVWECPGRSLRRVPTLGHLSIETGVSASTGGPFCHVSALVQRDGETTVVEVRQLALSQLSGRRGRRERRCAARRAPNSRCPQRRGCALDRSEE